jgi:hypothetical protein
MNQIIFFLYIDACLSDTMSTVRVKAPLCDARETDQDSGKVKCFKLTPDSKMDFIVAYNPLSPIRSHGYQRRTGAQVDLSGGILTQIETGTVDSGMIATHGIFMLLGWLFLAPWGIFIVRYMKTRTWHLVVHISIMGFVGSVSDCITLIGVLV